MRALFLLLVLANVGFFAWARYVSPADGAADPLPLTRQIEPEKVKVVTPNELPASAPAPAPAKTPTANAAPAAATPAPTPVALKCMEWGSFTIADAPRAEKALEPLALGPRLAHRRTEETAGWWVFIPPQGNRAAAVRKAAELKALGVDEYFIVQEAGPYRWSISLGVFRNEDAAQARLGTLRDQGVRSAKAAPRELVVPKVWLQVKNVDAPLQARLKDTARTIEGSELRECAP
ncbi:MAG: SPOR domain-containing protein [Betaproteobacteria bacterium]|nr:SPOR domain-containing protein [Betaproteobacteria bacterium]